MPAIIYVEDVSVPKTEEDVAHRGLLFLETTVWGKPIVQALVRSCDIPVHCSNLLCNSMCHNLLEERDPAHQRSTSIQPWMQYDSNDLWYQNGIRAALLS